MTLFCIGRRHGPPGLGRQNCELLPTSPGYILTLPISKNKAELGLGVRESGDWGLTPSFVQTQRSQFRRFRRVGTAVTDILKKQRLRDHCPSKARLLQSQHHASRIIKGYP